MTVDEHLHDLAAEFNRWLGDKTVADTVTSRILTLAPKQWRQFCQSYADGERARIAGALTERSYSIQEWSPKDAIPVARLGALFAKSIVGATDEEMWKALELEADALREHARSLLMTGEYDQAKRSADEAAFNYSLTISDGIPTGAPLVGDVMATFLRALVTRDNTIPEAKREVLEKATRMGLILGQIIHCQGRTEEGLAMMASSCEMLLYCFDNREMYVKGRMTYAKVLAEGRRFADALEAFQSTAALANELEDLEVQALLVANIGACYYHLGAFEKAKPCAETAMAMFESLELPLAAIRPRTLLVMLLMEEGEKNSTLYSAAAAELFKTRAAWLSAGMKREAAEVMVQIIRAFILARRQGHINWAEMNRTFTEARLGDAAMRALQHLEALHATRPLTLDDVEDAEDIIADLDPTGAENQRAG